MKYPLLVTWGLKEMARRGDWFNPSGNYWNVVRNGFLGGELLYDSKTKKVYGLCLKELRGHSQEFVAQCEGQMAKDKVSDLMTYQQAQEWLKTHDPNTN